MHSTRQSPTQRAARMAGNRANRRDFPLPPSAREIEIGYLQISFFGSHGGGSLVSQLKSDSTSLPGRFVEALSSVPAPVQLKCWVLWSTFEGLTLQEFPDDQVALSVPAPAPPVWLLTKCQVPVESPQDCPLRFSSCAARAVPA